MPINEGYIGITNNYPRRKCSHLHALCNKIHCNPKLQNVWNKYGDLEFEVLHSFDMLSEVLEAEIQYRPSADIGWNCKSGGSDYFLHSDETKQKISAALKGKKMSDEAKKKMSLAKKGKVGNRKDSTLSEETKNKIRLATLGKINTKETKEKISNSLLTTTKKFKWVHIDGRTYYGNHKELRDYFKEDKLAIGHLLLVVRSTYKQHKGWSIYE